MGAWYWVSTGTRPTYVYPLVLYIADCLENPSDHIRFCTKFALFIVWKLVKELLICWLELVRIKAIINYISVWPLLGQISYNSHAVKKLFEWAAGKVTHIRNDWLSANQKSRVVSNWLIWTFTIASNVVI